MANAKRDTVKVLEGLGGIRVDQPEELSPQHVRGDRGWRKGATKILVAIVDTEFGDHFKEVSYPVDLEVLLDDPRITWMELSKGVVDKLKAHPRSDQLIRSW